MMGPGRVGSGYHGGAGSDASDTFKEENAIKWRILDEAFARGWNGLLSADQVMQLKKSTLQEFSGVEQKEAGAGISG